MNKASVDKTSALLRDCNVMSLATCEGNTPWAASVFFVADESFNLYFISGANSRHSRDITTNPGVAVTINKDHSDWCAITGLQVEGVVSVTAAVKRERILSLYLEKFPMLSEMRDHPANEQERLIVERLVASDFYRVKPRRIRLIDNSVSFGFKTEMEFPD